MNGVYTNETATTRHKKQNTQKNPYNIHPSIIERCLTKCRTINYSPSTIYNYIEIVQKFNNRFITNYFTKNTYDRHDPITTTALQVPDLRQTQEECGGVKYVSI